MTDLKGISTHKIKKFEKRFLNDQTDSHLYAVIILKQEATLNLPHRPKLPLVFADGMVGVISVFDSYESAVKYRGDSNADIIAIKK